MTINILTSCREELYLLLTAFISVVPRFIARQIRKACREYIQGSCRMGMLKGTCLYLEEDIRAISCMMVGNGEGWIEGWSF